jgi:carbonic anhydrase
VHWGYEGEVGPELWHELAPEWATCIEGEAQSPIDLSSVLSPNVPADMSIDYRPGPLTIVNNGHTIQVNVEAGSGFNLGDEHWRLLQFHFHAASEHTIDGIQAPLEMHLVHQNDACELAVVGVMFEAGDMNMDLGAIWAHLPTEAGPAVTVPEVSLDVSALLPDDLHSRRYSGSLTTPPCSEGVSWFVLDEHVQASEGQLEAFRAIHNHNFRPVQPLNGRVIEGESEF